MDENIALPEEWMEEIVDELTKVVILKGVVVYCGADATLLQEICTPIFAAKSETTKKKVKRMDTMEKHIVWSRIHIQRVKIKRTSRDILVTVKQPWKDW